VKAKFCAPGEIIAGEPNDELRGSVRIETGIAVTADNLEVARSAETILLGVKPAVVLPVVREIAAALEGKLVISLAAGVRLENMEAVAAARFMRVMTNTPSAIGRGASAIAPGLRTTMEDLTTAEEVFTAVGIVVQIEEQHIDAVTALAGSGPAFIYTVIEALAEGAHQRGLPSEAALRLATQTVLGAAQLASETGRSPEELRRMVVTPGGTTAAGLAAMKKMNGSEAIAAAVEAATDRGSEMAKEFSA
jgi:pyrroline-5-carboxylate reductase